MFPTIEKCFYENFPWSGILLPDHGEVWSLKWERKILEKELLFSVRGVRLPYLLEKRISFKSENEIVIDYKLSNLSDFPMDFIWAGHIMLRPEKGCKMKFHEKMKKAVCTYSESGAIGKFGDEFDFPIVPLNGTSSLYDISSLMVKRREMIFRSSILEKSLKRAGVWLNIQPEKYLQYVLMKI